MLTLAMKIIEYFMQRLLEGSITMSASKAASMRAVTLEEAPTLPVIDVLPEQAISRDATAAVPQERIGSRPVQFNLSEDAYSKLVQLKQSLGVASKTEVVRLGLAVLAWVVEELTESHKIVVQRGPNNVVELAFPYLKIKKKS